MATIFYDSLIDWQKVHDALNEQGIDGEERLEVMEHIEHTVHTEVLLVIISQLPAEKHDEFLEKFDAAPHDPTHLDFLKSHGAVDIETKVKTRADEVLAEVIADLVDQ